MSIQRDCVVETNYILHIIREFPNGRIIQNIYIYNTKYKVRNYRSIMDPIRYNIA